MSITAGTYDVGGSGTDYPGVTGLDDAINDVPNSPSGLTGDLTFNVMGDVNWTVSFIKKVEWLYIQDYLFCIS